MSQLEFYFDYLSPYAYLAHSRLLRLDAEIVYRPFDIRQLMPAVGNLPTSVNCKPKNNYIQHDLKRWVVHYDVPFARNPDIRTMDSRRLLRATLWAQTHAPKEVVATRLFEAMWGIPKPLSTSADVTTILKNCGISNHSIETEIDSTEWDHAVNETTANAIGRGVFGAPTIFVGDEMFFGNDRMDFVRAELERQT